MKFIKWMFYFDEGNLESKVFLKEEDERIRDFITENPKGTIYLPNQDADVWVNFDRVKCFTRQIVDSVEIKNESLEKEED